ncbi:MAG: sugar phosphate isomerase/epimerase [Clostridiales bacterium]|nr:sugar phosphate isomerase/epimerase [Clostridiales bacterium]
MNASKMPVALELYSVRNTLKDDLEGTLEKVKGFGYDCVEFPGSPVFEAKRIAAAVKAAGLWVCSWHVGFDSLICDDEKLKATIEYHLTAGNKYLIIPWLPNEWLADPEAIKRSGERLNELSEKLGAYGLYTGYHNHSAEFKPLGDEGKTAWTLLREATCDKFVMQIDTGNAFHGGANVNAELLAAPGRSDIIHLKPYSSKTGYATMIGNEDDMNDYPTILSFCRGEGKTHTVVIEYECVELYTEMEGARLCVKNLREKFGSYLEK